MKTGVADAGYLVIADPNQNSQKATAFTPQGLYFAQNKSEIYEALKNGNEWLSWNTNYNFNNLFGGTSQMSNNGFYFYPNGTAKDTGAYGIDVRSFSTTTNNQKVKNIIKSGAKTVFPEGTKRGEAIRRLYAKIK